MIDDKVIDTRGIETTVIEEGRLKLTKRGSSIIAFNIPKDLVNTKITNPELQFPGIYFLIGDDIVHNNQKTLYVGKAGLRNSKNKEENKGILARLREHADSKSEWYREIWRYAMAFVCLDTRYTESGELKALSAWNLTEISNIEYLLYHEIPKSIRINSAEPNKGSEFTDNVNYTEHVQTIKQFLTSAKTHLFDNNSIDNNISVSQTSEHTKDNQNRTPVKLLNDKYTSLPEVITPDYIVRQVIDLIPKELFNENTRFIDPICKGGEFLREIYNRLMQSENMITFRKDPIARSNYILGNQIFGIALSETSKIRTTMNLNGFGYNIKTMDNYVGWLKELREIRVKSVNELQKAVVLIIDDFKKNNKMHEREELQEKISKLASDKNKEMHNNIHLNIQNKFKELFNVDGRFDKKLENRQVDRDMHFNVIIGNPPYQDGRQSIYNLFLDTAIEHKPEHIAMIVKNNWMVGDTLQSTRDNMIDFGLEKVINYPICGEAFPGAGVSANIVKLSKKSPLKPGESREVNIVEIRNGEQTSNFVTHLKRRQCLHRGIGLQHSRKGEVYWSTI